jgi:hypothetical protein
MTEYGQVINPYYDPRKNNAYDAFVKYFNNPILTKIKNVDNYSVYMTRIHTLLGNSYRYLILFVEIDVNVVFNTSKNMDEIKWVSLQTRTLEDYHDLKSHTYQPVLKHPLNQKIKNQNMNEKQSTYHSEDFPLVITLLHTRKDNVYEYQPTGTIISAIETFQTIINFIE